MVRCLIVDDEAPARELIAFHLADLPGFEAIGMLNNGAEAFTFLQQNPVDLMFLDVNMPRISGFELIRSLKVPPTIILTTAYREFAVEAYDLEVFDYLVKPITKDRFLKAISRYLHLHPHGEEPKTEPASPEDAYQFFKVGREQVKIFLKDILFIEGFSDYVKVHTTEQVYLASETLNHLEQHLPQQQFIRIHKSFIAGLDKVKSYNSSEITLNDRALPIGRIYKVSVVKQLAEIGR